MSGIKDHPSTGLLGKIQELKDQQDVIIEDLRSRIEGLEKFETLTSRALLVTLKQQQSTLTLLNDLLKTLVKPQKSE